MLWRKKYIERLKKNKKYVSLIEKKNKNWQPTLKNLVKQVCIST